MKRGCSSCTIPMAPSVASAHVSGALSPGTVRHTLLGRPTAREGPDRKSRVQRAGPDVMIYAPLRSQQCPSSADERHREKQWKRIERHRKAEKDTQLLGTHPKTRWIGRSLARWVGARVGQWWCRSRIAGSEARTQKTQGQRLDLNYHSADLCSRYRLQCRSM